ncbi:virus ReqiPepy6 Gp37-like protein [Halanaerobium congolense]|uniref:Virus ReqiPepy6 Gp37-like protein n=1 Tax=Halanaerobium congolense TaxID=54121 RepID=A0A1G8PSJ5_9FIRM|nr:siphovirus ReqiPepy6 Gp37-like family protein [Halanaerobium congolense]SDI95308.1 virus ReqiPepy6 Gp37-like protein [Halanaerobium congolense]SES90003.1 virus ReqiPepy6 Gp37-like protein [Halanaerobium congolense]
MQIKYYNPPVNDLDLKYTQAHNFLDINYSNKFVGTVSLLFSKVDNSVNLNYFNGFINNLDLVYNGKGTNILKANYEIQDNKLGINYLNSEMYSLKLNYENKLAVPLSIKYNLSDNGLNLIYTGAKYLNKLTLNYNKVAADTYQNSLTIKYELTEIPVLEMSFEAVTNYEVSTSLAYSLENSINSNFSLLISSTFESIKYLATSNLEIQSVKLKELLEAFKFETVSEFSLFVKSITNNTVIYILTPDFDLLAILEEYQDFVWNRKWRSVDDFQLTISKKLPSSKYLQLENYIAVKKGDKVTAGRIAKRNLKKENDSELITVSGKGLGEIFENRIAFNKVNTDSGYDSFSGPAESAMKHYVDVNVINPTEVDRKVDNLINETDREKGATINYRARFQKISEILYEISKTTGLGWELEIDLETKEVIFKVLTAKIRKGVRLSPNFDSVKMIQFEENKSSQENKVVVAGQGEGADRMIRTVSRNEV